jgi:hypothetical protein
MVPFRARRAGIRVIGGERRMTAILALVTTLILLLAALRARCSRCSALIEQRHEHPRRVSSVECPATRVVAAHRCCALCSRWRRSRDWSHAQTRKIGRAVGPLNMRLLEAIRVNPWNSSPPRGIASRRGGGG